MQVTTNYTQQPLKPSTPDDPVDDWSKYWESP